MVITTRTLCMPEQQVGGVDRAVRTTVIGLSHSKLQGLFDLGCATVNGLACAQAGMRFKFGDQLNVRYDLTTGLSGKATQVDGSDLLALHAMSLGLEHPVTGERLQFKCALPKSLKHFIGK